MPPDRGPSRVRAVLLASLVCLACAAVPPTRAERWAAPDGTFALDLPEGEHWTAFEVPPSALSSFPPGVHLIVRRTRGGDKGAVLVAYPDAPTPHVSDQAIEDIEKTLFQTFPLTKLSGERVTIQGRPAYRVLARLFDWGWVAGVVVIEAGVTYMIMVYKTDGDPLLDPELASCLESIRLP